MLRVDSTKPCQIIYSVARHEYLGYVIEPHIVQLNPNGEFSLTHQRLFSNTAGEFANCIDETDIKLIKLLEEIEQGNVIKRYYKKPIRPSEYFTRIFTEQIFDTIRPKMEKRMAEFGAGWKDATETQTYTVHDIYPVFADAIVRRGAARAGLTWHFARPPVIDLEYEMDCRRVMRETVI